MKEYIITDTRHEIMRYTYIIEAESEEEAMKEFYNGLHVPEDSETIDCTSSEVSINENV